MASNTQYIIIYCIFKLHTLLPNMDIRFSADDFSACGSRGWKIYADGRTRASARTHALNRTIRPRVAGWRESLRGRGRATRIYTRPPTPHDGRAAGRASRPRKRPADVTVNTGARKMAAAALCDVCSGGGWRAAVKLNWRHTARRWTALVIIFFFYGLFICFL